MWLFKGWGIFKRKYAYSVLLQKANGSISYQGGYHVCCGLFPQPDVDSIRDFNIKENGAENVVILFIHRCAV